MDKDYEPPELESKDVYGITMIQSRNNAKTNLQNLKDLLRDGDENVVMNLAIADTSIKFAESNTIGVAFENQIIGMGCGQQSRIHASKLALDKSLIWMMRKSPYFIEYFKSIDFKSKSRQQLVNTKIEFIEKWLNNPLEAQKIIPQATLPKFTKDEVIKSMSNYDLCLSTDGFFPFRDNIDLAAQYNIKYILQPQGSNRQEEVIEACQEHNIELILDEFRKFSH